MIFFHFSSPSVTQTFIKWVKMYLKAHFLCSASRREPYLTGSTLILVVGGTQPELQTFEKGQFFNFDPIFWVEKMQKKKIFPHFSYLCIKIPY